MTAPDPTDPTSKDDPRPRPDGSDPAGNDLAMGVAFGIALGAGIGAALGNVAVGIGVGLVIGVAVGTARSRRGR